MKRPILVTSIPPVLRGIRLNSENAGGLQNQVIHSWTNSGFTPISVNTIAELNRYPNHAEQLAKMGVETVAVEPPRRPYPNYLPPLRKSLQIVIETFPGTVIAITNADIVFALSETDRSSLFNLDQSTCLLAHRTDIDDQHIAFQSPSECTQLGLNSSIYRAGIDFVAAKAVAYKKSLNYLSNDLTFGLPWWDLFLPLSLIASRVNLQHLDPSRFIHLRHSDRWETKWWNQVGKASSKYLYSSTRKTAASQDFVEWGRGYSRITSPLRTLKHKGRRVEYRVSAFLNGNHCDEPLDSQLLELAKMTEKLVCSPDQTNKKPLT